MVSNMVLSYLITRTDDTTTAYYHYYTFTSYGMNSRLYRLAFFYIPHPNAGWI